MSSEKEKLYQERLNRLTTAMDLGKPDKVPIRLFLAEFMAKYAGFTLQEVYYDMEKNIEAVNKVSAGLDLDAVVSTPSLWWGSLHEATGAKYLKFAGRQLDENMQFQYVEGEYMLPEDYDEFIADPTKWVLNVYLPRIHEEFAEPGSYRSNLALIKGAAGMIMGNGMQQQAGAYWAQELGMPVAISGMFKAPFDTLGDTLRGLRGIMVDLRKRPDKVLAALDVLVPHNTYFALATAGGDTVMPAFCPLHRGSYPFLTPLQWDTYYWPTLKKVIELLWEKGKRTLFYAEGDWTPYLEKIAEVPEKSIVFQSDRTDLAKAKKVFSGKFCISGNVPNTLLTYGTPEEVRDYVKKLIDDYAADGGFIIDTAGVMQTDAKVENVIALIEAAREYGVY